jgi:hypothetical protein
MGLNRAIEEVRKGRKADSASLKEQLDQARIELEQVQRRGDWTRAGELAYGIIPDLEKRLAEAETKEGRGMMGEEAVTPEQIAAVVSRWTGVPVEKMLEGERGKLLHMEDSLKARVVGQDEAIAAVSQAVRRARPGCRTRTGRSARLVPVPGSDRRRQDRIDQGARRVSVRRRARDGAYRHVGIHGEALGCQVDRRSSGLCRL